MPYSPTLCAALEAHGVTQAHLEALLRFFACQQAGKFEWHSRGNGHIDHCELRLVFPSKPHCLTRIADGVLVDSEQHWEE
jgi:hypothetical protein